MIDNFVLSYANIRFRLLLTNQDNLLLNGPYSRAKQSHFSLYKTGTSTLRLAPGLEDFMRNFDRFSRWAMASLPSGTLRLASGALGCAALFAVATTDANAQSLTPMRGKVTSFTDRFAVRVSPGNPYDKPKRFGIRVYDEAFRRVGSAHVAPERFVIGANSKRSVLVIVPFEGRRVRRVRICAEILPSPNSGLSLRTRVCGRFIARRLD